MLEAVAYATVAGAFALTALVLAVRSGPRGEGGMLAGACAVSAIWGGLSALSSWQALPPLPVLLAELLRSLAWLLLLLGLLQLLAAGRLRHLWRDGKFAVAIGLFAVGLADLFGLLAPLALLPVALVARIGLAILGLALIENVFARAEESARWSHKHLLLGLALMFLFDLVLYSDAYLFRQLNPTLALARPFIQLIALPLILVSAARAEAVPIRLRLSQQAAFQATTLLGCGLYLLVMAALGYAIRAYDLPFGPLLFVLLLAIAVLALMVLLLSRQVRARLRRLVAENFFHLRYDYRSEWLRFIETMASTADHDPLHVRAVRAFADVFDCSSGALYLRERDGDYALAGRWRWTEVEALPVLPAGLVATVAARARIFDLRPLLAEAGDGAMRAFLAHLPQPWLAAPVRLRDETIGVVLLGEPRAMRALTWEDEDLAFILGVQVGSYIAEDQAMRALMQAQQFERLSKRFSFVAHDLKNVVSQLSVMVENAKRHKENPEFVADAFTTVGLSVEKMRHMLARLRQESEPGEGAELFDAGALVETLVADRRRAFAGLEAGAIERDLPVALPRERLIGVIDNLIQNAADASAGTAKIQLSCRLAAADWVTIEVADDGPGMTPDFVRARLFEPFRSTKSGGYGLGLYHSRETIEQHGGQLRVETMPGMGTKVRILLPLAAALPSQAAVQTSDLA